MMTKAELEARVKELEAEVKDLIARLVVMGMFSPSIHVCRSCGNYYALGYVCRCGRDNSVPDEEWRDMQRRYA